MHKIYQELHDKLESAQRRVVYNHTDKIDFITNDYLGLGKSKKLVQLTIQKILELSEVAYQPISGRASRILGGETSALTKLEEVIRDFHKAESAVFFSSGFNANLAFWSTVPQKEDVILFDEAVHASIREGVRLSSAKSSWFKHNDLNDLENLILKNSGKNIFISTESLFSMHGDFAPVQEMQNLADKYRCILVIDEAHSIGIFPNIVLKENTVVMLGFGKALGAQGGAVLGKQIIRDYIIQNSKPFIYTTAPAVSMIGHVLASYELIQQCNIEREKLFINIEYFNKYAAEKKLQIIGDSLSPIKGILVGDNFVIEAQLKNAGFSVKRVGYPTVLKDQERIRIVVHSCNKMEGMEKLIDSIVLYTV